MESEYATSTKEELLKKIKNQKITATIHGCVVLLLVIFAIFSSIEKGFSFQTFLPLFFIPMQVIMFLELKKVKQELATRK